MRHDRALLLYALVKGFELDVGKIVKESILDYAENNFSRNIPHPSLITLLCIKGGIKVNEEEEKSPKATPLTLIGALKAPVGGEEIERIRKRKRTEEQLREPVPTVEAEEDNDSAKERGGFEADSEQPVLFTPPLQKKQHQPQAELEIGASRELRMRRATILNYYLYCMK